MGSLSSPLFWSQASSSLGLLQQDGSLRYVLLDRSFKMKPLIRKSRTTFTQFLTSDTQARACKVAVNGNMYDLDFIAKVEDFFGVADDPSDTSPQGQVVENGRVVTGDSRPESFWFGQLISPTPDQWAWTYAAGKGNPPAQQTTLAAIGGVGPLIVGALPFGTIDRYRPGAPPGTVEPLIGEPPPPARPYLIQRSNRTFQDVNSRPPATGKTIIAYCAVKRTLLVAVQPHGASPGQTHESITSALAQQGFEVAVFFDGSDSATLVFDGKLVVAPGDRKNRTIDIGVGFRA